MKHSLLAALLVTTLAMPAAAQEHLNVYSGAWDVFQDQEDGPSNNMEGLVGVEYRGDYVWNKVRPNVGAMVTSQLGQYYYAGLGYDAYLNSSHSLVLTPNFAVGYYGEGDSKDLGGALEFKSGLELAYEFQDKQRLGVAIHHLSNASIYDSNPGTEVITVQYSYPLDKLCNCK